MKGKSAMTPEFHRGHVDGDGTCLFSSFLGVIMPFLVAIFGPYLDNNPELMKLLNENLRMQVANYIREHTELHDLVINSSTRYLTVEEYCRAIERGALWGGDIELNILSKLYNILICKIDLINSRGGRYLMPSYYGQDNPLATQCVYLHYNGVDHFDPLYLINKQNPNEKETIFDPNDEIINGLMVKFINEKLNYHGDIILGINPNTHLTRLSQSENSTITGSVVTNGSTKRKASTFDDVVFSSDNNILVPVSIPKEYYVPNKRAKNGEDTTDQMPGYNNDDLDLITLLQTEGIHNQFDSPDAQLQAMVLDDQHQEETEGAHNPSN